MDKAEKQCFKTLPTMANDKQGQAENNNNTSSSSTLSQKPLPTKNAAAPTKRIIKKIPLEFNKLKQSGLHIKLAEALSKQNASASKNIATARPFATASETYGQKHQQLDRQTAGMPLVNKKTPPADEQSSQIKSLLITRILNKSTTSQVHQPQQKKAIPTTTPPRSEASATRLAPSTGIFTVPIAKADLTVRPKPPLLLNLVNQLPKHRAMWASTPIQSKRQHDPPARTMAATARSPVRTPAQLPAILPPRVPAPQQVRPSVPLPMPPTPLIVLENKVLAPYEKMDFSVLRLPNGQRQALSSPAPTATEVRNGDKLGASAKNPELSSEMLAELPITSVPNATSKKIILNANKLKLPRDDLVQLAQRVWKLAMENVQHQKPISTDIPDTKSVQISSSTAVVCRSSITTIPANNSETLIASCSKPMSSSTPASANTTNNQNNQPVTEALCSKMPSQPLSAEAEVLTNELSAVDFIAQLTASDDINTASYMELSAEELSMNATFGCLQTINHPPPEDDLPIGKILQMQDMDVLHATLNVNGNKPNVLCISPNAIKLLNSVQADGNECQPVDDIAEKHSSPDELKPLNVTAPKDSQSEKCNEEQLHAVSPTTTVSLLDVLTQEQPPPQGEPQLPFRSSDQEANLKSLDRKFADALGIQNLLTHLAAENVVPPRKEEKSEETAKIPRKKLVKTRPVLSAKRSAKALQTHAEAKVAKQEETKHSRKRPYSVEGKINGIERMPTSSTSDDNADSFHGFDDETLSSKRVKLSKERETDISDDATPDYDETEEEPQLDKILPAKKGKTECALQQNESTNATAKQIGGEAIIQENKKLIKPITNGNEKSSMENLPVPEQKLKNKRKRPRLNSAKEIKKPMSKTESTPSTETVGIGEVLKTVEPESMVLEVKPVSAKKKPGRPRKSIVTADAANSIDSSAKLATPKVSTDPDDKIGNLPTVSASTPTTKRCGRKPKAIQLSTGTEKSATTVVNEVISETCKQQSEFYMRLLLIRKREQLESDEELREDGRGEGDQQCGLCLVRCNAADWQLHLGEHYGVGWLLGEPAPLLTRSALIKTMKKFLEACRKRFSCRLCSRQLTSALGMITHLESCGANERIECDQCKNSYTKLSYQTHYRRCSKRQQTPGEEQLSAKAADNISTPVYSNSGRVKRNAALKAKTKLLKLAEQISESKDFDCDSSDYDMGADKESSSDNESEGVDFNEEVSTKSTIKKKIKTLYGRMNVQDVLKKRWKYFSHVHYAKSVLYPHLLPLYEKLSKADAKRLLPSKESTSMRYAYDKVDDDNWMQLAPLQAFNTEYEHVCYLGNAVKELAWVPLPSTVETQYLLCSQRTKMLGFARQFRDKPLDELMLLLECKVLPASDENAWPLQTRLHYGICVPHGPVHSFAFMPTGGYDESINRLGLLAVGSSFGAVIYALPLRANEENIGEAGKNQLDTVIVLQPIFTLSLDVNNPDHDPCTKICWSEGTGHNLLVCGYASGNVAFYDIADEQGLNCIERNKQRHFLPASFFYLGERNIYYLELHYDTNGPRWLAVGTMVRKLCIYDIANWSLPLPILCDPVSHLFVGGVYWPPLWESLAVGSTEVYKSQYPRLITVNPTGINFTHAPLDLVLCSPRAVHFNWDQMTLVTITDNGDVAFIKCQQFNYETSLQKRASTCRIVSLTEPRYLGGETAPKSISSDEFKQDYGLVVKPLAKVPSADKSTYINIKRRPNFDLLNMLRLNCVRWNWNAHARNWIAVGAEHGLLRIIKCDPERLHAYDILKCNK